MELTGLTLSQVLTALLGVGAVVVVLYLLKLRRRQITVPFVKLWQEVLAEKQSTRLFSRLKRLLSLLLALALVALLSIAMGDPRLTGAHKGGRTLVVLVDASASMQATDVAPSRLQRAETRVRELIDELGPADRMLIAQLDATVTPLSPLTDDPHLLLQGLDGITVTDLAADLHRGVRFALDVLRDQPSPEIVVVSDGRLGDSERAASALAGGSSKLSYIRVGHGGVNVGITAFAVRRYPLDKSQSEVLAELWNPSEQDQSVELSLFGDGQPVDVQRLIVKKGERLRRFFANVSGADRTLEARIALADGRTDDLPADDRAYARLPERRRAKVLAVTAGNLYLSAALLLDEYLEVTEVTPDEYPPAGEFDVTIFDSFAPTVPPPTHTIYLYPQVADGQSGPLAIEGTMERPVFDRIERDHPLLRFTALHDVNVATALRVRLADGDRAIASDNRGPLIVTGRRNGKHMVAFTFDVRASDLPLRVAWPILLINAIDHFVEEDAGYVSSYRTGDSWHIPVPPGVEQVHIEAPDGQIHRAPVEEGRAVFAGARAGFYRLRPEVAGETLGETVFAANLGPHDEGDIKPADALAVGAMQAGEVSHGRAGVRHELWLYLVAFAMLLLLGEWFSYHRRWTV